MWVKLTEGEKKIKQPNIDLNVRVSKPSRWENIVMADMEVGMVVDMDVDKVTDMVADMEVDKVADMEMEQGVRHHHQAF